MNRAWVVAVVVVTSLSCVCGPPPPPPKVLCVDDSSCGHPALLFCNTVTGECEPSCRDMVACNSRPPGFEIPECDNPLGCWCDEGRCVVSQCSDDSQCGALACRNGQCVQPPAPDAVARCSIWPESMVIAPGALTRFHVLATDAMGEPVVVSAGASWQAMAQIVGSAQGHSVEVMASVTPTAGAVTAVRASFGSVQCEAKWQVLPLPGMGELLTSVVEEGSGLPVPGATVVLSGADGGIIEEQVTDGSGLARLTPIDSSSTLSVFHANFSYQTIANIEGKTRTIFVGLKRNRADRHGGYAGTFEDVPVSSNLRLARAGLSSSGDALELTDELEPTIATHIQIGSAVNDPSAPVPMGTFMRLGDQQLKSTVTAFGQGGRCADAALSASGSCSVQSAWALTANLPLGDVPIDLNSDQPIPSLMTVLQRTRFSAYASTVRRDLDLRFGPAALGPAGFPDLRETTNFTTAPLPFHQLRLGFHFGVKPPAMPRGASGSYLANAIASAVALVPGRGLIPIGVGVGSNDMFPDAQIDRMEPLPAGVLALHAAPPHHGLEGQPTAMVLQLFNRRTLMDGRETSTILARLPSSLPYDPEGRTPIDLSAQSFPEVVDGQFRAGARTFTAAPISNVSLVRVTFTDGLEAQWDVLVDPAAPTFTLPPVPGTLRDRIFRDGTGLSGEASQRRVSALRIVDTRPFDEVIGENPAVRAPGDLIAWSHADAVLPSVSFGATPAVLPRNSVLEVKTFGFDVGRHGKVQVSYEGANCAGRTFSSEPVIFTVSQACQGQAVVIRAELLDVIGRPLDPPVATSFTTTIQ